MITNGDTGIEVVSIDTSALGDRSYLATDGRAALVVDPQRDIDRVLAVAASRGVRVTHVFETHVHNDYVTGGLALARVTGAAYHLNAADEVGLRAGVATARPSALVEAMLVEAIATPGHTFTHLSYALARRRPPARRRRCSPAGRCCTGRPGGRTCSARSTGPRWPPRSTRQPGGWPSCPMTRRSGLPTGSAASARPASPPRPAGSDLHDRAGEAVNPALTQDQDQYVAELLAGLDAYPAYYAHMGPVNAAGPAAPTCHRPPRGAGPAGRRIAAGEWVADLRSRRAFAAGHVSGSLSFEHGSDFTSYLGWLIPWGTPLTLLGDSAEQVAAAQRDLTRIGIDRLAGAATGPRRTGRPGGRWPRSRWPASPTWPPSGTTDRSPCWTCAAPSSGRRPCGRRAAHPAAGAAGPARRGPAGRDLGALPVRLPGGHGGRLDCSRRPGAPWSPSMTSLPTQGQPAWGWPEGADG